MQFKGPLTLECLSSAWTAVGCLPLGTDYPEKLTEAEREINWGNSDLK